MTASPAFTFITPTYQCAAYLRRCHWSLACQTIPDWEWIVVDDASTDDTGDLIASLGDARIRYHRFAENRGRGAARDYALQQARGRWTAVQDADDLSFPDRLARSEEARAQGFEFIASPLALMDHDYRVTGVRACDLESYPRAFPHATLCGDSALLRRIGYPVYRRAQDQTMVLTLANAHRGSFCAAPLYLYHENAGITPRGAFASHWYALKQVRALARQGVLARGAALTRAQATRWAKLAGLLPFFLWPPAYQRTLRRRTNLANGANLLSAANRAFIAECAQRFPNPAAAASHGA